MKGVFHGGSLGNRTTPRLGNEKEMPKSLPRRWRPRTKNRTQSRIEKENTGGETRRHPERQTRFSENRNQTPHLLALLGKRRLEQTDRQDPFVEKERTREGEVDGLYRVICRKSKTRERSGERGKRGLRR